MKLVQEIQEKEIAWGVHDGSKPTYGTAQAQIPSGVVLPNSFL